MKKYIVVGGWVTSRNDGERHYVSAEKVARLYNVDPRECYLASGPLDALYNSNYPDDCIILSPRYDGNYTLPKETE